VLQFAVSTRLYQGKGLPSRYKLSGSEPDNFLQKSGRRKSIGHLERSARASAVRVLASLCGAGSAALCAWQLWETIMELYGAGASFLLWSEDSQRRDGSTNMGRNAIQFALFRNSRADEVDIL
jgi:hypothetical protein